MLIMILLLCAIFQYSNQFLNQSILEGKQAEEKFIADEKMKDDEIQHIKNKLSKIEEQLQIWPVAESILLGWVKKVMVVPKTLLNLGKKRYYKWKQKKFQARTEKLLQQGRSGLKICRAAFAHKFFSDLEWTLEKKDKDTRRKKEVNIGVKLDVDGKSTKFTRNTKFCLAQSKTGEKIKVYISGMHNFRWRLNFSFFVFVERPKSWFQSETKLMAYLAF